jgi:hypothetical protein
MRAPSASRRGTERISAIVMSAVSSVSTLGVLVTVMPRLTAASTSMLSTPLPKFAISFRRRPGQGQHRLVDPVGNGGHQHVGRPHRLDKLRLAHGPVVHVELRLEQLAHARLDAFRRRRVTITSGLAFDIRPLSCRAGRSVLTNGLANAINARTGSSRQIWGAPGRLWFQS